MPARLTAKEYEDIIKAKVAALEGVDVGLVTADMMQKHLTQQTFGGVRLNGGLHRLVRRARQRESSLRAKALLVETSAVWNAAGRPSAPVREGNGVIGLEIP